MSRKAEEKQLSFQLTGTIKPQNTEAETAVNRNFISNKANGTVRSIVPELKKRKEDEERKIFGRVISRINHLLK